MSQRSGGGGDRGGGRDALGGSINGNATATGCRRGELVVQGGEGGGHPFEEIHREELLGRGPIEGVGLQAREDDVEEIQWHGLAIVGHRQPAR